MINLGWALTGYFCLSFVLFLALSNTIAGGIFYIFLLLPFYALVLLFWWIYVWSNRTRSARPKYWTWILVLVLQIATILTSPGNCYMFKQGANCYSNLQVIFGGVPRIGPSSAPHWKAAEDAFIVSLVAYGAAVVLGLVTITPGATTRKTRRR
jgi:hypothetical protein